MAASLEEVPKRTLDGAEGVSSLSNNLLTPFASSKSTRIWASFEVSEVISSVSSNVSEVISVKIEGDTQ